MLILSFSIIDDYPLMAENANKKTKLFVKVLEMMGKLINNLMI